MSALQGNAVKDFARIQEGAMELRFVPTGHRKQSPGQVASESHEQRRGPGSVFRKNQFES